MKKILLSITCTLLYFYFFAQMPAYPYPVHYFALHIEGQPVRMAYMDVAGDKPNGSVVLLFHGKNFNGYYWKQVIYFLAENGYRVIVPDQVGWGMSDKPNIHYSFPLLAYNTRLLLDSLGIPKVAVIAHSMGGMLGARFCLMYPQMVSRMVYEDPIGLEDYKTFVPYKTTDQEYADELKANFDSMKKYQESYFPVWKPEYDQYVTAQYEAMQIPDFKTATWASALTYEMIYDQPVLYEFKNIEKPVLMFIGQADRTVVGKQMLSKDVAERHGQYPLLGRFFHQQISGSTVIELKGVGHIPHLQSPEIFRTKVLEFLAHK